MTEEQKQKEIAEEQETVTLVEFLEATPPNKTAQIQDLAVFKSPYSTGIKKDLLRTPEIQLHCPHEDCNGVRFFRCVGGVNTALSPQSYKYLYVTYRCSNCQKNQKVYSLAVKLIEGQNPAGEIHKFGEIPTFGPPTPPRLVKLIGPDRETFIKGRRCENQGLGIGAFIYYRRVVENQKNRILTEIIKVSRKLNLPAEKIKALEQAIQETQFSKALDSVKDAVPESLLIDGHSPLKLLHRALSEGVHARSDEDCLEIASSVRVVLAELSERLAQALKDEAQLNKALKKLMEPNGGQ